jgi:hypothetical protein
VRDQLVAQFGRLEHAPVAGLAAGLVAAAGAEHRAPSARTWATLRCVAGWAHISRFIAGASSSGQRSIGRARHSRLSSSSARPCASLAMKSALAGATTTASASRDRLMCAMLLGSRASHWLVATGRPDLILARMQFAANITFHILFPTISIALGWTLLFFRCAG